MDHSPPLKVILSKLHADASCLFLIMSNDHFKPIKNIPKIFNFRGRKFSKKNPKIFHFRGAEIVKTPQAK